MRKYLFYTDGASTMKKINGTYVREAGGWGFIQVSNNKIIKECNGGSPLTTNNEQELYGIYAALKEFLSTGDNNCIVEIRSDSAYCINIFTQWIKNWEKNDWTRGKKKEKIENCELIKTIWNSIKQLKEWRNSQLVFTKVKGHSGEEFNERVDRLAVEGKELARTLNKVIGYRDEVDPLLVH